MLDSGNRIDDICRANPMCQHTKVIYKQTTALRHEVCASWAKSRRGKQTPTIELNFLPKNFRSRKVKDISTFYIVLELNIIHENRIKEKILVGS